MQKHVTVTAVFEKQGAWYIGYVPEVAGVNAQEKTLARARKSLTEALRELAELHPRQLLGKGRRSEQLRVELANTRG